MAEYHSVEEFENQIRDLSLEDRSNVRAHEYVKIMKQLKKDVGEILKRQNEVIEFTRPPNKFERIPQRVRIKQICNPLEYYWDYHKKYVPKCPVQITILFVGMNPSPSAPSGIPFAADTTRRYWNIEVGESPSGKRFWELIGKLLSESGRNFKHFLGHCFVINCSPLYFVGDVQPIHWYPQLQDLNYPVEDTNIPLDNFIDLQKGHYVKELLKKSDEALTKAINLLDPELIIPIGGYAWKKVKSLNIKRAIDIGKYIPHPSPKNSTEEEWMDKAMRMLTENGVAEILNNHRGKYRDIMMRMKRKLLQEEMVEADGTFSELVTLPRPAQDECDRNMDQVVDIVKIINPLHFSWREYEDYYLKKMPMNVTVLFLGMNPSMNALYGIPFCDVQKFWSFWGILPPEKISRYIRQECDDCDSGQRFWKLVEGLFGDKSVYKKNCFVMNCSPFIFARYIRTSVLTKKQHRDEYCDVSLASFDSINSCLAGRLMQKGEETLYETISTLNPSLIVAMGTYAKDKVSQLARYTYGTCVYIEHPDTNSMTDEEWIKDAWNKLQEPIHTALRSHEGTNAS